jgi:hypothetical protein
LVAIRVDKANSAFTTRDGVLFDKACKTLLAYPGGKLGFSYEVPPGVEFIGEKAFYNRMLWFVTLPEGVKAIGAEAFASLAPGVAVRIADSVESIGKNGFMHVDFLTGTKAVMAKEIAQLPGIQFYPDDMTADELLSGYVQGRDSLERLLKCWVLQPDAAGMYEEIRSAIADNGESKLTEFEQFCADLYALAKLQAIKPGGAPAYMYINRIYDRHDNMQDLALRLTGLPISQQLMDKLAQTKAQPKSDPVLWSNKALKTCLGKGSNFVPENPQKNTCLLILSEESRVAIEDKSVAAISQPTLPMEQADTAIKIITTPTSISFTGDPNMASIMIYLRVSYPYAGRYGYYGIPTFKAYHCKAEFTAYGINGNKRTQIAKVTIANYQGDVIYGWKFWADFPIPGSSHEWKKFIENIDKWGETHY